MTKLHDGCEEEYKRRHDALIAQRGIRLIRDRTVILVSGVPADIFLDMMRSILRWKKRKQARLMQIQLHGKHASLRLWTGSQMMWTG